MLCSKSPVHIAAAIGVGFPNIHQGWHFVGFVIRRTNKHRRTRDEQSVTEQKRVLVAGPHVGVVFNPKLHLTYSNIEYTIERRLTYRWSATINNPKNIVPG